MNLAEIRKKHPEYDDMEDQDLADAVHGKHYKDMDRGEFYKKIGHRPKRRKEDNDREMDAGQYHVLMISREGKILMRNGKLIEEGE